MPYNNMFPVGYQPAQNYFQQPPVQYPMAPYQAQAPVPPVQPQPAPVAGSFQNGNNQPMQQPVQQTMTPPTIHAEIVQVDSEADVDRWPVNAGASQMFITKAEDKIIIKTMGPNGPLPLDVFDKRPPAPVEPPVDFGQFVTWDKLDERVAAIVAASQPARTARAAKKEEAES